VFILDLKKFGEIFESMRDIATGTFKTQDNPALLRHGLLVMF
jgi:hypothetical protein